MSSPQEEPSGEADVIGGDSSTCVITLGDPAVTWDVEVEESDTDEPDPV